MKPGNSMTGTVNSIPFKCTKCGFLDPMEIDIAEEVCDLISYRGIPCLRAYCIQCDSVMIPVDVLGQFAQEESILPLLSHFSFQCDLLGHFSFLLDSFELFNSFEFTARFDAIS